MKNTMKWIRIVCVCILIFGLLGCSGKCSEKGETVPASNAPQSDPTEPGTVTEDEILMHGENNENNPQPTLPTETDAPVETEAPAETGAPENSEEPDETEDPLEIDIPITTPTPTPKPTATPKPGETAAPTATPSPTPTPTPVTTPDDDPIELPELP